MKVVIRTEKVTSLNQLRQLNKIYFEKAGSRGHCILRVINKNTNATRLLNEIESGKIYIPVDTLIADEL